MTVPPYLTAKALDPVPHGFFSRAGGVSTGIYGSLNCGPGSADSPENVAENRQRCYAALAADHLFTAYQVHSAKAAFIDSKRQPQPEADALVTATPGLAIGILTADCIPVLFHDAEAGLVGAAHAGWRGALGGILEACIALMVEQGSKAENIHAAIGPCLRPPHFQVGNDLLEAFTDRYPDSERFFTAEETAGKYQLDLTAFAQWRMMESGIYPNNISDIGANTLAEPERYFSYRHARQQGQDDYGRNLSAIALPS